MPASTIVHTYASEGTPRLEETTMDAPSTESPTIATVHAGPSGPVEESDRIVSLDVLRGVAVLGILVLNIQSFAMISGAYMNPNAYGSLDGANGWVWRLTHVLGDQKFMGIFAMLFGAGVDLMTTR